MATIKQRNAAVEAAKEKAIELARVLIPDTFGFEQRAEMKLNDPANAKYILSLVDAVIHAVETTKE